MFSFGKFTYSIQIAANLHFLRNLIKMPSRKARVAAAFLVLNSLTKKKEKRRIWMKEWFKRRDKLGFGETLFRELREEDENCYKNFVRMTPEDFDFLLEKVTPFIQKRDTNYRKAISPTIRLCLTLRYLAAGDSFISLSYLFRVGYSTIVNIIPECLAAIYEVLHEEYLKVIKNF